jgi:hypothetical protein
MVPGVITIPKMMMHHPEAPAVVYFSQLRQAFAYLLIRTRARFVIIHRRLYPKQLKGLPQTYATLLMAVIYQLPLFSRP